MGHGTWLVPARAWCVVRLLCMYVLYHTFFCVCVLMLRVRMHVHVRETQFNSTFRRKDGE
ncbi:hypothetical protein K504DRAFT_458349 [Pleomassaria siparia CBS 279.74]|uniref:Uncharacterized protein n=1 Tax=Pleomassaria siparia CBS 279.74 TaxID=1314801 RepID=A0A6G1K5R6_9PLEO|nr:hypothetical protein K504DRAFT_458349 [Pleomassaria siparia CBS 279.74]